MATKRSAEGEEPPVKKARIEPVLQTSQEDQECAVGITVYVSPDLPGFKCTVKQRYTDFLVNEILPTGEVLHLTEIGEKKSKRVKAQPVPESKSVATPKEPELEAEPKIEVESEVETKAEDLQGPEPNGANGAHNSGNITTTENVRSEVKNDNEVAAPDDVAISAENKQSVLTIFGENVTSKLMNLYSAVLKHPQRKARDHNTVKSEMIPDKSVRTDAHKVVRVAFNSKLQSETLQDEPGIIAIKVAPPKGASGARGERNPNGNNAKGQVGWNELGGQYLHFTLYKENKDTMEALSFIASQLKIPAKNFEFAGTKDRRGVTVQKVAVFRVRSGQIAGLNRMARGWRVGGFEYKKHGLALGDLLGNEFALTLRDLTVPGEEGLDLPARLELAKSAVSAAAESFETKGYLNYYGLQRFGSFSTGTHITGLKILQGDLQGAIDNILTYSRDLLPENVDRNGENNKIPTDDIIRADCIRLWREGRLNPAELRDRIPRRFSAESSIMQYLSKKDRKTGRLIQEADWQGALMTIQRGLRLMYVHAYQSLVWNMAAGKRWELYGDKVVEGDLVIVGEKDDRPVVQDEVDEAGEPIIRPSGEDAGIAEDSFTRARPVSKQEAESDKHTIFDIVLPQPGFDVLYPSNAIGDFYKEFMASEQGGGLDPYSMRRSWKDASMSGGYRKMMARPLQGVGWEVIPYGGMEEQLVGTDMDVIQKREREQGQTNGGVGREGVDGNGDVHMESLSEVAGAPAVGKDKLALVLRFQLGSSQYATMALRELTKGGALAYKPEFNTVR
ncbi:hypothetical protein LTR62_001047 [Meristemomyces frigidus]|uniref:TRUD domain-containing protein n=1 Tax=Meristemomyces frigidus TaxID=1508187 RepID=A0AAN7YGH5_9PEZI|nr:hypothetical protein LTR62_001047 [Meristemomyces frigidus]